MPPAMAAIKCAKLSSSGIKEPLFAASAFELDFSLNPAPVFRPFVLLIFSVI